MNEKQARIPEEDRHREAHTYTNPEAKSSSSIGMGKKFGLYGCGFMVLAVILVFIVLVLTGIYNPFEGTEGVGP